MSDSNTKSERYETIELLMPEHQLLTFALLAHEEDITLNEYFTQAVMYYIQREQNHGKEDGNK